MLFRSYFGLQGKSRSSNAFYVNILKLEHKHWSSTSHCTGDVFQTVCVQSAEAADAETPRKTLVQTLTPKHNAHQLPQVV